MNVFMYLCTQVCSSDDHQVDMMYHVVLPFFAGGPLRDKIVIETDQVFR